MPVVPPLHWAAMYGKVSDVAALVAKSEELLESRDHRGYTPLMCAVENVNATEMVRYLVLDVAADINAIVVSEAGVPQRQRCCTHAPFTA